MATTAQHRILEAQRVKNRLELAGWRLTDIDKTYRLASGAARDCLRNPNEKAERAIANALGARPHQLWPSRYDRSGQRLSPQPSENYARPPAIRQRRNANVSLAKGELREAR